MRELNNTQAGRPLQQDVSPPSCARRVCRRLWRLYRAPMFSPTGFLVRAVILTVIYLPLHAAGLRHHVSVLSGSLATGSLPGNVSGALGIAYICFYFAVVLVVPILVIAAGLMAFGQMWLLRRLSEARERDAAAVRWSWRARSPSSREHPGGKNVSRAGKRVPTV